MNVMKKVISFKKNQAKSPSSSNKKSLKEETRRGCKIKIHSLTNPQGQYKHSTLHTFQYITLALHLPFKLNSVMDHQKANQVSVLTTVTDPLFYSSNALQLLDKAWRTFPGVSLQLLSHCKKGCPLPHKNTPSKNNMMVKTSKTTKQPVPRSHLLKDSRRSVCCRILLLFGNVFSKQSLNELDVKCLQFIQVNDHLGDDNIKRKKDLFFLRGRLEARFIY